MWQLANIERVDHHKTEELSTYSLIWTIIIGRIIESGY